MCPFLTLLPMQHLRKCTLDFENVSQSAKLMHHMFAAVAAAVFSLVHVSASYLSVMRLHVLLFAILPSLLSPIFCTHISSSIPTRRFTLSKFPPPPPRQSPPLHPATPRLAPAHPGQSQTTLLQRNGTAQSSITYIFTLLPDENLLRLQHITDNPNVLTSLSYNAIPAVRDGVHIVNVTLSHAFQRDVGVARYQLLAFTNLFRYQVAGKYTIAGIVPTIKTTHMTPSTSVTEPGNYSRAVTFLNASALSRLAPHGILQVQLKYQPVGADVTLHAPTLSTLMQTATISIRNTNKSSASPLHYPAYCNPVSLSDSHGVTNESQPRDTCSITYHSSSSRLLLKLAPHRSGTFTLRISVPLLILHGGAFDTQLTISIPDDKVNTRVPVLAMSRTRRLQLDHFGGETFSLRVYTDDAMIRKSMTDAYVDLPNDRYAAANMGHAREKDGMQTISFVSIRAREEQASVKRAFSQIGSKAKRVKNDGMYESEVYVNRSGVLQMAEKAWGYALYTNFASDKLAIVRNLTKEDERNGGIFVGVEVYGYAVGNFSDHKARQIGRALRKQTARFDGMKREDTKIKLIGVANARGTGGVMAHYYVMTGRRSMLTGRKRRMMGRSVARTALLKEGQIRIRNAEDVKTEVGEEGLKMKMKRLTDGIGGVGIGMMVAIVLMVCVVLFGVGMLCFTFICGRYAMRNSRKRDSSEFTAE